MENKKLSKKAKRVIIISVILIIAIAAGVVYSVLKKDDSITVDTVKATVDTVHETIDTTGNVEAENEESFILPAGAKVTALNVKEGDIVSAGQVIATFDTKSLEEALDKKESIYEKAQTAYTKALKESKDAEKKISSVKKQISELENSLKKTENQKPTTTKPSNKTNEKTTVSGVSVSDSLVKRFMTISKLFGISYTKDEARKVLTNALSAGSSLSDINKMMNSLNTIGSAAAFDPSSFDFSSLYSAGGAGSISSEMTLAQLKAQLSLLEAQSSDTYVDTYKTIAEKARKDYADTKAQIEDMKDGWTATQSGIVSELKIKVGDTSVGTATSNADIGTILTTVASGGDVSSMISSFFGNNAVALKVLSYPLVANISLNKYDILDVELNQDATITSASGQVFDGKVSFISATASSGNSLDLGSIMNGGSSSSTIPAQVTISGADKSIIIGTDVDISIITKTVNNAVVVPVEAICIDGSDIFVYTYDKENNKAVKKDVTLGISNDTVYEVLSGVNEGDVLIKNTAGLKDGAKVSVK